MIPWNGTFYAVYKNANGVFCIGFTSWIHQRGMGRMVMLTIIGIGKIVMGHVID